jgi:hypothetical protein
MPNCDDDEAATLSEKATVISNNFPESCTSWLPSDTVSKLLEYVVVCRLVQFAVGCWISLGLSSIVLSESFRATDSMLRHGEVGIAVAYCQLFIHAISIRFMDDNPLNVVAA